jgi:circadian clock protein KaiC
LVCGTYGRGNVGRDRDAVVTNAKAKTGISGFDEVLSGGLSRGHIFLLEGKPGAGKTTAAVQFVLEGAKAGEQSLYITLSETEQELRQAAASHGWTLGNEIDVFELIPPESLLAEEQQQSLLYSYDLELRETTKQIVDAVERAKPSRVVLDSLSKFALWLKARSAIGATSSQSSTISPVMAPP